MEILEMPRFTMLVAGWEYGRLRRDVMRCSRNRRFFLPSLPSPSTSDSARRRLKARLVGTGAESGLSKVNSKGGLTQSVKENVSLAEFLSQVQAMLTCVVAWG